MRPQFQITIDTEGDNLWARPAAATTMNAACLPRFQALCERYGFKPTYLVNWEMANSAAFQEFGRDVVARATGEIGMHLHAWDSPPIAPLTTDDAAQHPYLIEFPETMMRQKIDVMTDRLEEVFQVKMESHRAGRWTFNTTYARMLAERGYKLDCSVTPHVSWKRVKGAAGGNGGADYSAFPDQPYWYEFGNSRLLEVPVSILRKPQPMIMRGVRHLLNRPTYRALWLRPNGRNLAEMREVISEALHTGRDYVQFMLHSSELMPGGSPAFDTESKIEALYDQLDALFAEAAEQFEGGTLAQYAGRYASLRAA